MSRGIRVSAASSITALMAVAWVMGGCAPPPALNTTQPVPVTPRDDSPRGATQPAPTVDVRVVHELMTWIQQLRCPPLEDRPYVRVRWQTADCETGDRTGFLLEDTDDRVRIEHDCDTSTFSKPPRDAPRAIDEPDRSEGESEPPCARLTVDVLGRASDFRDARWLERHSHDGPVYSLARAAYGGSTPKLADDDEAAAAAAPVLAPIFEVAHDAGKVSDPLETLRRELGSLRWRAALDEYTSGAMDRPELQARLLALIEPFAGTDVSLAAKELAEVVGRMVAEDARRPGPSRDLVLDRLDRAVWELRDVTDSIVAAPDYSGMLGQWAQPKRAATGDGTALGDLYELGFTASSRLASLEGDTRVLRCQMEDVAQCNPEKLRWDGPAAPLPTLATYGDAAALVSRMIGRRPFQAQDAYEDLVGPAAEALVTAANALVRAGKWSEVVQAAESAEGALRQRLVHVLAESRRPGALRFVRGELESNPDFGVKVEAARALALAGRRDWLEPLLIAVEGAEPDGMLFASKTGWNELVPLVARAGGDRAVERIRKAPLGTTSQLQQLDAMVDVVGMKRGAVPPPYWRRERAQ